ncbi:hypothetical protein C8J56DRAFT_63825 [Mycena floridula]|nr:hypothetical protein C8J56DRAFT_63825 [Mycena floridula]
MAVVQPQSHPDLSFHGHQRWILYLSGIAVTLNDPKDITLFNPSGKRQTLSIGLASPDNKTKTNWSRVIAFDSGCRYSHFNVDIIRFFQNLGLIGIPPDDDDDDAEAVTEPNYVCNQRLARLVTISFHFGGSTTATKPYTHIIPGTDLILSAPRPTDTDEFIPSAIASTGDNGINVWGNVSLHPEFTAALIALQKHMLGMVIGYHAGGIAKIQLAKLKPELPNLGN